jgi:ACS family glucarate transporter-like MFS transporter
MWIAMGQYFASNFTFFFCLTWLFPYLQRTYQLEALRAGFLASAPLLAGAMGNWAGGLMVDALFRRGSPIASRRLTAILGFSCGAMGLLASLFVDGVYAKVFWLAVAIFGSDMTLPASWAFCTDIGRAHAGAVAGTMNMAGNIGSFVTSLAFPYLLVLTGSPAPFFIVGVVLNVTAALLWTRARPDRPLVAHA